MTRSILCGLLALISVGAVGILPVACQSGGVGDQCTPEDEYDTQFAGFKVAEENIESRSFQCSTRICLVNHFQGRVSCPEGQSASQITSCNGPSDTTSCDTAAGEQCVASQVFAPACSGSSGCPTGTTCNNVSQLCECNTDQTINGVTFFCEPSDPGCTGTGCSQVLKSYLCHKPGNCQSNAANAVNTAKQCCVPGTDTPVAVPVCGQCDAASNRSADQAVYCSCRCCPPCCSDANRDMSVPCSMDAQNCGSACDPNFNYCKCPNSYTCSEIRANVGLGDAELTGAYCIKAGTDYTSSNSCGNVVGNADPANCQGVGTTVVGDGGTGDGG
jgi:hypothetical protein